MEKTCRICKYENGIFCLHHKGPCNAFEKYENRYGIKGNDKANEKGYTPIKPSHYNSGDFDVIDFCHKNKVDFLTGNIIKYVVRAGKKDKTKELEDLQKAQEYLRRKIEYLKGDNE